ncbi:MAG: serine hydrolase [Geodermatophilaceae bacterium]|nr:serine hydrolase [Geodermatophilaceae bacterium]
MCRFTGSWTPRTTCSRYADCPRGPRGTRFSYRNSGYVLLALIVERVSGRGFHELVIDRVLDPARMTQTAFFGSDALPGDAAIG